MEQITKREKDVRECSESSTPSPKKPAKRRVAFVRLLPWMGGALLMAVGLLGGDQWTYQRALTLNTPNPLDHDFYNATHALWDLCRMPGSLVFCLAVYFAIWALHSKGWRNANVGLGAMLSAVSVCFLLKHVTGRLRPNHAATPLDFLGPLKGFSMHAVNSFPSSEVTTAFALATVLARMFPRIRFLFYLLAATTGVARLVSGGHYFSDVVAGAMVGVLVARYAASFAERAIDKRRKKPSAFLASLQDDEPDPLRRSDG